jgi:hypothetical protein
MIETNKIIEIVGLNNPYVNEPGVIEKTITTVKVLDYFLSRALSCLYGGLDVVGYGNSENITQEAKILGYLAFVPACIIAPIWEEWFKRVEWGIPFGLIALIVIEHYQYVICGTETHLDRCLVHLMHMVAYALPYKYGVVLHSAYNFIAIGLSVYTGSIRGLGMMSKSMFALLAGMIVGSSIPIIKYLYYRNGRRQLRVRGEVQDDVERNVIDVESREEENSQVLATLDRKPILRYVFEGVVHELYSDGTASLEEDQTNVDYIAQKSNKSHPRYRRRPIATALSNLVKIKFGLVTDTLLNRRAMQDFINRDDDCQKLMKTVRIVDRYSVILRAINMSFVMSNPDIDELIAYQPQGVVAQAVLKVEHVLSWFKQTSITNYAMGQQHTKPN